MGPEGKEEEGDADNEVDRVAGRTWKKDKSKSD